MKKTKLFILGGVIAAGILLTTGVSVVYALGKKEDNKLGTEDSQVETETTTQEQVIEDNILQGDEIEENLSEPELLAIDETNFPGTGFREYIKQNCDINKDGKLSKEEISSVTKIYNRSAQSLDSLEGIEYFTELNELYVGYSGLSEIDLSKCLNLECLNVEGNFLEELDLSKNTKLKSLYCMYNQLKQLDLSANENLGVFYYGGNKELTSIILHSSEQLYASDYDGDKTVLNEDDCFYTGILPYLLSNCVNWVGVEMVYSENDMNVPTLTAVEAIPIAVQECAHYQQTHQTEMSNGAVVVSNEVLSQAMIDVFGVEYSVEEYLTSGKNSMLVNTTEDGKLELKYGDWGGYSPNLEMKNLITQGDKYIIEGEIYMCDEEMRVDTKNCVSVRITIAANEKSRYGYVIENISILPLNKM